MSKPSGKSSLLCFEEDTFLEYKLVKVKEYVFNFIRYYSTFIVQYLTLSMKHIFTLQLCESLTKIET